VKFHILISRTASRDVDRLEAWLLDKDPRAAVRVGEMLESAIASLDELPERGKPVSSSLRELNVRFGRGIYVVRYQIGERHVVVTRIFHGRERR
jgi:plasmid stabilization system protein ParE